MNASALRVAARYLSAAPFRLDPEVLRTVNIALVKAGMGGNSPFRSVPMAAKRAEEVLASHALGFSGLKVSAMRGEEGEVTVRVVSYNSEGMATLTTSLATFQWVTSEDGSLRIVAYVT